MRIEVVDNEAALASMAAGVVVDAAASHEHLAIGLPSGNTPLGMYRELCRRVADAEADLSNVTVFAVDELFGVPRDHPATNVSYFREHLGGIPLRALHVFDSEASDPEAECERFTTLIADAGGLDLAVLGIGANGHIAFNEPHSSFDSRARKVALAHETRGAYVAQFGSLDATPTEGLTLGIADLLAARRVLLLASGASKAAPLAAALEGPEAERLPASALRRHSDLLVILDHEAGRLRGSTTS